MSSLLTLGAVAAASALSASVAQAAVSFTGLPITENFDGLPTTTPATSPFSATTGTQATVTGTIFQATRVAGSSSSALPLTVDNTGATNSGAIYSYGSTTVVNAAVTGSSDRALGSLASSSNQPGYGVEIVNNAATAITSVTISLSQEQYRSAGNNTSTANIVNAQYLIGAAGSASYLSATGTDVDGLDLTTTAAATAAGITPTTTPLSVTIDLSSTPVAVGQSFYLKWFDNDDAGSDGGVGIDNFSFSAVVAPPDVPEPASLALIGLGGIAALRRRRA